MITAIQIDFKTMNLTERSILLCTIIIFCMFLLILFPCKNIFILNLGIDINQDLQTISKQYIVEHKNTALPEDMNKWLRQWDFVTIIQNPIDRIVADITNNNFASKYNLNKFINSIQFDEEMEKCYRGNLSHCWSNYYTLSLIGETDVLVQDSYRLSLQKLEKFKCVVIDKLWNKTSGCLPVNVKYPQLKPTYTNYLSSRSLKKLEIMNEYDIIIYNYLVNKYK